MKDNVRIKSFAKGLLLQLNEEASFDDILAEVAVKFQDGKTFFGNSSVAITFQGRTLTDLEETEIVNAIQYNCNLKVVCIIAKDEHTDKMFSKAVQVSERQKIAETELGEEVQVFRGNLSGGETLETPSSIIILGDVESGCSITSEKSILIVGNLYGKAHAGKGSDGKNSIVIAREMMPQALSIGDYLYTPPKKSMWGKKKKEQMMAAKILEDQVQILELTKELLSEF